MSYAQAMKHERKKKWGKLCVGQHFNPGGGQLPASKPERTSESRRRRDSEQYARTIGYTAGEIVRRGGSRREAFAWLRSKANKWWKLEYRQRIREAQP
jgi:hypothetical protein